MTDIYDRIGDTYDTTRTPDPQVLKILRRHIDLQPSIRYLDIGCGTGNYTTELNKIGGKWTGLEPSSHMLALAKKKDGSIDWIHGSAESLPFENDTFDGVICTLAVHHFTDLGKAFREIDRVLRPNGKLVMFTATPEQVSRYWLTHYFPEMMERDSEKLPSVNQMESHLKTTQLRIFEIEPFYITNETADFFCYSGKYRPSMYLSEKFRNGISSFRTLISDDELTRGLALLKNDIEDGTINRIIDDSHNDLGDYCFVVVENNQPRDI